MEAEAERILPSLLISKGVKFSERKHHLVQTMLPEPVMLRQISSDNIVEVLQVIDSKMGEKFDLIEANDLLKLAGILDDSGKLAAQYR